MIEVLWFVDLPKTHETSHLKAYGSWRWSPIFQALLFFECGLCSHLEAAESAETHCSCQKYQKSLITTAYLAGKKTEEVPMGGGDVHIVEMCVCLFFLIRMSPFAHLLSLHRLLKCYFQQKCQNPLKKQKQQKNKKFHPMPVQLLRPSLWVETFFGVLFSCFLGSWEKFSPWQTSTEAQLSPLHILYWCLHWVTDFGYWAIRENVQ